jgi:Xaa-Pro aminopeptidase
VPKIRNQFKTDARLIVASSETDANLLYATRFFAPDPFIFLIRRGKKILVMNDLEIDRARQQARVDVILSRSRLENQLKEKKRKLIDTAAVLHLLFSLRKIRSLLVPYNFPAGLADQLRGRSLRIKVKPHPFFEEREFKRLDEIKEIEKALSASEAAMEAAIQMIRESRIRPDGLLAWGGTRLTSELLKQRIASTVQERGGIASHTIVACGEQGCDPHQEGIGPMKANQPIIIDIFPRSQKSGYWGDITRTVVKGKASAPLKSMFHAVLRGQEIALKQIRAGVQGKEIHQAILNCFQQQGFETGCKNGRMQGFFHGTGHGVGLEIHEAPRISPRSTDLLKAGHVVTVEPGLYYPGIGGVRLEDLVVITDSGNRNLTKYPKHFEIQ